jgi:hypothetical protein
VLDPAEGAIGMRQQLLREPTVASPPPQLAEEHDEQRGGVGGAVVGALPAEGQGGGRAEPDLVQDPAGFLFCCRVDGAALALGQGLQSARGQAVVPGQQHPGGEQRVAPEQGHKPGGARGHHGPVRVCGVEDAQRPDVFDAAAQRRGQVRVGRGYPGGVVSPLPEPAGRHGMLHRLAARVMRPHRNPVVDRHRFHAYQPLAARRDHRTPGHGARAGRGIAVTVDQQPMAAFAAASFEGQRRAGGGDLDRGGWLRQPGLDLEQVGEVGIGGERDRRSRRQPRGVADGDVLAHAVADVAAPDEQHGGVGGGAGRRRQAAEERRGVRVGLLHGQRLGGPAADSEGPAGQDAGVLDEQPLRLAGQDVAAGLADAEGRALDEGHRAGQAGARRCLAGRPGRAHRVPVPVRPDVTRPGWLRMARYSRS